MTSSSHPRFRLLIGWCCLMSSALLMLAVYVIYQNNKSGDTNSKESKFDKQTGFLRDLSLTNHVRLIRDSKETWIYSERPANSFLSLNNTSVNLTVGGLYYFHVQVSFKNISPPELANVTLLKNKGPGTQERRLSVVKGYTPGSLTMICLVKVENSMSISLDIHPVNYLSREDYDTYWEIILFS